MLLSPSTRKQACNPLLDCYPRFLSWVGFLHNGLLQSRGSQMHTMLSLFPGSHLLLRTHLNMPGV